MPLHWLRAWWRSEWQMPQNTISIWTSCSAGSRRAMVVGANGEVWLATEYAFALYMARSYPAEPTRETCVKRMGRAGNLHDSSGGKRLRSTHGPLELAAARGV